MPTLHTSEKNITPPVIAALLLAGLEHLKALDLTHPTATDVLNATGASRSRAYELVARINAMLPEVTGGVGRPEKPKAKEPSTATATIAKETLSYVFHHPGCVAAGRERGRYSIGFRKCLLDLFERQEEVSVESFVESCCIPLGTFKDWLRGGTAEIATEEKDEVVSKPGARGLHIETVLAEWKQWDGGFTAFCKHLKTHCRVPFGKTMTSRILEADGVRPRRRRLGRSPDEDALRGAFETFFPHAQWVGDGSLVPIDIDNERFIFNLQLNVDAYSDAYVGADVSLVEDSEAVINAIRDAEKETGVRPIAILLDNKPCNHTDQVKSELGETILIPSTLSRAQNKGHVEGGFGLFKSTLDGLVLVGGSKIKLAASILSAFVIVWSRTINHRPRRDRGGLSRVELATGDEPTREQADAARVALEERLRKQQKARETEAARQNPVVRQQLAKAYDRLELDDPTGNILTATARYPLDAVVEAIAIFEGRQRARTLPSTADARYLLGIARNIAQERETWEIACALWDERVAAGDLIALMLGRQQTEIQRTTETSEELIKSYVDRSGKMVSRLDQFFWLTAAADVIREQDDREASFKLAARRISATITIPHQQRQAGIRFLAAKVRPLR